MTDYDVTDVVRATRFYCEELGIKGSVLDGLLARQELRVVAGSAFDNLFVRFERGPGIASVVVVDKRGGLRWFTGRPVF